MSNTNHDFLVKNGLVVGQAITSTGTLTQAGQTFPASDGSAGQYLKTNGSGALSWGTVSTSFNITDGTTTDTVGLTETVTFTGGTNISLAVTDNTVTITNDVVDSDDITEGSSNLFYTDARAVAAIQGASNLTIDGGTLYIDTAADRVGISDTSPQQKLDVAGNIGVNGSEVIDASGNIVGSVADSAMTVGGSLAGVLSNLKVQYGTAYSGTPIQGSFFFDSLNQKLKVYTGSAFIDAVPAGSGGGGGGGATDANTTFRNYSYTLTGTTSAVSGVDDNELTAGAFIVGHKYTITSVGNTDFTAIGASGNTVGVVFTATGVGTGTGQAKQTLFYDTTSSATRVVAYVNGIKQVYGSGRDFVATTGTSVAFTYNLGSGDTVDLQVYELLTNAAYYLKTETLATTAVNSNIATAVADYLPLVGGTMTGAFAADTINNASGNLTIASTQSILMKFDSDNNQTNREFNIQNNSGDQILKITEAGESSFTGNVGIGTTAPLSQLQVGDSTTVSAASRIVFGKSTAASQTHLPVIQHSSTNGISNDLVLAATSGDGAIRFYTGGSSASGNFGGSSNSERLRIDKDGDVGIGTNSPDTLLHVQQSVDTSAGGIQVRNSADASGMFLYVDSSNHGQIDMGSAGHLQFRTGSTDRVIIEQTGDVGIGLANPLAKLHVNGDIVVGSGDSNQKIYLEGAVNDLNMIHRNSSENTTIMTARHAIAFIIDSNADDSDSGSGHFTVRKNGTTVAGSDEMFKILPNGDASFHGNHLQLPKSANNPTGTNSGQLYYDTTNNAVKFYDGTSWRLVNEIGVRVTSFDVFGDSSSVALYQLNANGNDTGGNYNLTINGASFNTGKFGNAWNGTGTNAAYSTASGLNVSGGWSMSFWYKSSTTAQNNKRLVTLKGANITAGWNNYNGSLGFYIGGVNLVSSATSVTRVSQIPDAQVNDGSWHHLAFSVTSSGSWVIYLDGTSYSGAVSGEGRSFNSNSYLAITNYDSGQGYNTIGLVDQLRIFNRVISAGEVTQLYNTSG